MLNYQELNWLKKRQNPKYYCQKYCEFFEHGYCSIDDGWDTFCYNFKSKHLLSIAAEFESAVIEHILNNYKKYCDMDFSDSKHSKEWNILKNARIEVEETMKQ